MISDCFIETPSELRDYWIKSDHTRRCSLTVAAPDAAPVQCTFLHLTPSATLIRCTIVSSNSQKNYQKGVKMAQEKVAKAGVKRESGFLYFLDGDGDISRAPMVRGHSKGSKGK